MKSKLNPDTKFFLITLCIGILFTGILASVHIYKDNKEENQKEACIEAYHSIFEDEYSLGNQCDNLICEELGLKLASHGNWAKPIIHCQTESGGYILVQMPQSLVVQMPEKPKSGGCGEYFEARWDLAVCLYSAGYLEELT